MPQTMLRGTSIVLSILIIRKKENNHINRSYKEQSISKGDRKTIPTKLKQN